MSFVQKDKMDKIFGGLGDDGVVAILIHPAPDPDCLGAAIGYSVLLKEAYGLASKIFHLGEVSHPQNKSMKNILKIQLHNGSDFKYEDFSAVVVLDTDLEGTGLNKNDIKADVRLDHHEMDRNNGASLSDVRMVGSTSAIVWDYLKEFGIALEDYSDVATALVIGIKTDTMDFTSSNTSELDMEAFRALLPLVDKMSLAKVTKYPLPKIIFDIESTAFKNREMVNAVLVSFVGEVSQHNRDTIPTIADRFVRMDGVNTAVIMGIVDCCVVASARSNDGRVNVHDTCVSVFGKGNAGGKEGSGGARLDLGPAYAMLEDKDMKEKVVAEIVDKLKKKVFEALGEEQKEE
jgi:nanoRNase/pAp phosphatase (c-di-AMP/oligoRNAs hydrolase)